MTPTEINNISEIRHIRQTSCKKKQRIGFVATMGCLHQGHASLMTQAKKENDISIASIFVNPTQFNDPEDFKHYPKTLTQDKKIAADCGIDYLFVPDNTTIYPDNCHYQITENDISSRLEGSARPGHFNGVLTVVMKLLQIIKPDAAYFGEKDYQQYLLIRNMAKAFFIDTDIICCNTVRDDNGLAHSSRNQRLSPEQRHFAANFAKQLASNQDCDTIRKRLQQSGFVVDYIEDYQGRRYGAVFLDNVRLIDTVKLC